MKIAFLATLAIALCFSVYASSEARTGVWTAEVQDDALQMTLFSGRKHNNTIGLDEPLSAFSGLSRWDLMSSAANVQFELRRAAGTIAFEGRVANGTGAGHYNFTPSDAFLREMDSLGYGGFRDEMLVIFAAHDFSPQTLRELKAMGYQPSQHEVEEIAIFRVTPDFLREMGRLGYANLTLREALNFRVGRVDAAYINELRSLGYTDLPPKELANMAILGVTPKFIKELRSLGYDNLSRKQIVDMKIFGVTPDYIRKLAEKGYTNIPAEKLLKLRTMGADKILFKEKEK
jgi:hypothetical protein